MGISSKCETVFPVDETDDFTCQHRHSLTVNISVIYNIVCETMSALNVAGVVGFHGLLVHLLNFELFGSWARLTITAITKKIPPKQPKFVDTFTYTSFQIDWSIDVECLRANFQRALKCTMPPFYDLHTAYSKHINMIDGRALNKIKYILCICITSEKS